jgi:predicted lysophospholipase L1 biosynthesis ABC-type transport system permease subunit
MHTFSLRRALRTLFGTPFVTIVAMASLALGIGANAAIFSLFEQFLLEPLPVQTPEQLVNLAVPGPKPGSTSCGQAGGCDEVFSYPMFRDLEREQTPFAGVAAHVSFGTNLAYQGETMTGAGLFVSGSYFGVLAYTVAQRTREIGLRMALGADAGRIRGMVMRQVSRMTLVGGAVGLILAIGLGRVARSLLFEIQNTDPVVLIGAVSALTLVALGAGAIPARRASQIDPMRALHYE